MAAPLRKVHKITFKERLDALECPFTESLDEATTSDILLSPGESRFKILQWLFSRYDSSLAEMLDPSQPSLGARNESRVQRLLTAASAMCLCRYDDVELIRGDSPLPKQIQFIDRLLDLVCIRDSEFNQDTSRPENPNSYLEEIVNQEGFSTMLDTKVDLLPKDIQTEVEKMWRKEGWKGDKAYPVSTLEDLNDLSNNLGTALEKQTATLNGLKAKLTLQGESKNQEVMTTTHMLSTVLKELRQLAEGFTQCYESSISQWCNKTPPELSDLGPVLKRVHGYLQQFIKLLTDINKIRQIHSKLSKKSKSDLDVRFQVLDSTSRKVSDSFQSCLTVLEETLHRSESNFTSQHPPVIVL
ncbi:HAUS augmin-like complex subunit 7 [Physella acuta]|uniref:HAUS augmin-like complex subunit 7 n=1 Tax=Physella acuta TaxID=109671 RepID=UPI0027DD8804|nr:HAUS augmin-like complex subunit 7 [Physella acuta]